MKRRLLLLGNLVAFVFIADGLAMLLTQSTSTLGGVALVILGSGWFSVAAPRIAPPEVRPFLPVLVPKLGALALPVLFLPVTGLWLVATPSALTVWFAVAWGCLWVFCLLAAAVVSCPRCGGAYGRSGIRLRPLSRSCVQCGEGPSAGAA
jgi:hypothetical protein